MTSGSRKKSMLSRRESDESAGWTIFFGLPCFCVGCLTFRTFCGGWLSLSESDKSGTTGALRGRPRGWAAWLAGRRPRRAGAAAGLVCAAARSRCCTTSSSDESAKISGRKIINWKWWKCFSTYSWLLVPEMDPNTRFSLVELEVVHHRILILILDWLVLGHQQLVHLELPPVFELFFVLALVVDHTFLQLWGLLVLVVGLFSLVFDVWVLSAGYYQPHLHLGSSGPCIACNTCIDSYRLCLAVCRNSKL